MKGLSYIAKIDEIKDEYDDESVKFRLNNLKYYAGVVANRVKLRDYRDALWFAFQMGSGG